jgi:hypothetical protein
MKATMKHSAEGVVDNDPVALWLPRIANALHEPIRSGKPLAHVLATNMIGRSNFQLCSTPSLTQTLTTSLPALS